MHSIVCHISPLMEGLWQYQFSTSSWFCERFQFQSLASDSFLTSLSMRQSTEFNLTRRSLHNIRLRSICGWDHSSWHRPTVCGNPNLCVVQYSWQIFCTMSQIFLFLFLFHFLILVQLSEGFHCGMSILSVLGTEVRSLLPCSIPLGLDHTKTMESLGSSIEMYTGRLTSYWLSELPITL